MAKAQQELALKEPPKHGGRRAGAGRPRSSSKVPHGRRAFLEAHHPVHVTLRLRTDVGNLRTREMYMNIREATITVSRRARFRIVHMSIQRDHLHLLVEAANRIVLARGIQSFEISVARRLNSARSRRGKVFADRYHARALRTPREVRLALAYVMNNWRKHGRDKRVTWLLDPYSTAIAFDDWKERAQHALPYQAPRGYAPLIVWFPRTWLLDRGWKRAGRNISVREVPGPRMDPGRGAGRESARPSRSRVVDSRT